MKVARLTRRLPAACLSLGLAWAGAAGADSRTEPRIETAPSDALENCRDLLRTASGSYDLGEAERALACARAESQSSLPSVELEVRAALLIAELERIAFESLDRSERKQRSEIGGRIDAVAEVALLQIEELTESSERWRLQADLLATMIRSDFRAKKYHRAFEEAVDRSRRLDPENAHLWVTSAKPLVFAEPTRGQDFDGAIRMLDRALEIEPGLESALLLRAVAEERRGNRDRAIVDWRAALAANPQCEPAREELERLAQGLSQ